MIRVTIDLYVVSRTEDGNYWLSTITPPHWIDEKETRTWCKSDGELRDELREAEKALFVLVSKNETVEFALNHRFGDYARIEQLRSWPYKINLKEELNA